MRRFIVVSSFVFLLGGCSVYKELVPDPPLASAERGYVELKNGKDVFVLEKDKQYFMSFPQPNDNNFFLLLVTGKKGQLVSYLTKRFDDGRPPIIKLAEEEGTNDTLTVVSVDSSAPNYYWVIDSVRTDLELTMRYRYVPKWRFIFENKYVEYRKRLGENLVDRTTYESIGPTFNYEAVDYARETANLQARSKALGTVYDELVALQSLFPANIASSRDTAYQRYTALKSDVTNELTFQKNYLAVLGVFETERRTRNSTAAFLESAPYFEEFMKQTNRFPKGILDRAGALILGRLPEAFPFFEQQLRSKTEASRITFKPPIDPVAGLYAACGSPLPWNLSTLTAFTETFNAEVEALSNTRARIKALETLPQNRALWAKDSLFVQFLGAATEAGQGLPASRLDRFEAYRTLPCVLRLNDETFRTHREISALQSLFQASRGVLSSMNSGFWGAAETSLRDLYASPQYAEYPAVLAEKNLLVRHFEDTMFSTVLQATEHRAQEFVQKNVTTTENVSMLYSDPAFTPLYLPTFSAAGQSELIRKKKAIQDYLDQVKYRQFPETAVRTLYQQLTANLAERGVQKCRAIVEHGKYYKGEDNQIQAMVAECDVNVPKTVVRAKEYRRILALPVTNNTQGMNQYLFRVKMQIPSEAQFPVFDVNVKLPAEVAKNARQTQWFESITINKIPIKNEGRHRVTAPTADNNYESLITPVQMDKAGLNILEIRFTYPAFRVFEISVMAQVPIIRKN
jgi:hypothetical protein